MDIEVDMGKIAVAKHKEAENLTSTGIGSCLVITLYDPKLKLGAICHPMLSSSAYSVERIADSENLNAKRYPLSAEKVDTFYIEPAIEQMLEKMLSLGAVRERLEAKIIGAANMFSAFKLDVPKENISSVKKKLEHEGIKLVGECVGGSIGRSVEFALDTGIVTVKTKF